jgi:methylated-DNA-protein-cysteine methyltransferase related protein
MPSFAQRVIAVVRRIPPGRVATYGDVAKAAGQPLAARAVGNVMSSCGARDVPCHRVVAAAGRIGGFGGNVEMKRALLRAEGITVGPSMIRDFAARRWPGPAGGGSNSRGVAAGRAGRQPPRKLKRQTAR